MTFADLSFENKFKVFWNYKCVFIFLKAIDGYEFNSMDFKEFCEHKYHWGTGEADRWLEANEQEIFPNGIPQPQQVQFKEIKQPTE